MKRILIVAMAVLLVAGMAQAQVVKNPTGATFTPSPDHAQITKYILGFFAPGAADPSATVDVGKPTPDATNTCTVTFNAQPLAFGANYTAKIKALAGTAESVWSEASNPFDRVPGPPSKPVIR